jgi:hypothetical protein
VKTIKREQVVPAKREHIEAMKHNLREADEREAQIISGYSAYHHLVDSFHQSESEHVWTGLLDGAPVVMFGHTMASVATSISRPWFAATNDIVKCGLSIVKQSKYCVRLMEYQSYKLETMVHAENLVSLRWLKWCGFIHDPEPAPYGVGGELFYKVWL